MHCKNYCPEEYGVSFSKLGEESYEKYYEPFLKKKIYKYFFKTKSGCYFACINESLEICQMQRDIWLSQFKEYFL
jgi:hypothetical protein